MATETSVESKIQKFLQTSASSAASWVAPPEMPEFAELGAQSGGAIAVLTCLDPRCTPEQWFGAGFGPAYRNAGGRPNKDVVASLVVMRSLASLAGVLVVHHTDCGMTHTTDAILRAEAKSRTPDAASDVDALTFGCIPAEAFEATIAEDVRTLRGEKLLKGVEVRGMALDTFTGKIWEIKV